MIQLYAVNINVSLSEEQYPELLAKVSKQKQEKLQKFRFSQDFRRSLYGDLLVRKVACDKLGIDNSAIRYDYNDFGKPCLGQYPEFCFNISHSGDWVICGFSSHAIGVDIEGIQNVDLQIAKRFFSPQEYRDLQRQEDPQDYFYQLWTLKESYIKYMGKGLSIPLNSFSVSRKAGKFSIADQAQEGTEAKPFLYQIRDLEGYYIAVCAEEGDSAPVLEEQSPALFLYSL